MTAKPRVSDWFDASGKPSNAFERYLERIVDLDEVDEQIATLSVCNEPVFIEFPDDKDYMVIVDSKEAFTIDAVTTKSSTGTATVTIKIGAVALGGTANSASSTEQTQEHTSANAVAIGDDVTVTVSSNSSCEDLSINMKTTRAF